MSHFCIMVVTKTDPREDRTELEERLAPFHEFECTGRDDRYVQNIDQTAEILKAYESGDHRRFKSPAGVLHDPWDDRFFRDPTEDERERIGTIAGTGCAGDISFVSKDWDDGQGYRTKVHYLPDGFEDVQVPTRDLMTAAEYAIDEQGEHCVLVEGDELDLGKRHKYGWVKVSESGQLIQVVRRTNPNKRWDWWKIGGRWPGLFPNEQDTARKGDLNLDEMARDVRDKTTADVRKFFEGFAAKHSMEFEAVVSMWSEGCKEYVEFSAQYDALRDSGAELERFWDWLAADPHRATTLQTEVCRNLLSEAYWNSPLPDKQPDAFGWAARVPPLSAYAFLGMDGEWHSRGEMLMFGTSVNEVKDWDVQFGRLLAKVPDDHYLTMVDCHI